MFTLYLFREYLHWLSEIINACLKSGAVCVPTHNKLQHLRTSLRKIIPTFISFVTDENPEKKKSKPSSSSVPSLSPSLPGFSILSGGAVVWLRPPRIDSLSLSLPPDKLHFSCLLNSNSDCVAYARTHAHTHTHRHQNHFPDCGSSGPASTLCLLKNPQQPYILEGASSQFLAISWTGSV